MKIIRRSEWKAEQPKKPYTRHNPNMITIHHSYSPRKSQLGSEVIKGIQKYHKYSRKWNDIGYHYLETGDGSIYEGRPDNVVGGHVSYHNTGNIGICVIGDYTEGNDEFDDVQYISLVELCRYLCEKYPAIYKKGKPQIYGHCQFSMNKTNCPGKLMEVIPELINDLLI